MPTKIMMSYRHNDPNILHISRRRFVSSSVVSVGSATLLGASLSNVIGAEKEPQKSDMFSKSNGRKPTVFQHACMTLPYRNFPLERALSGIKSAGYDHVAWGVNHSESNGESVPVMSEDAPPEAAKALGAKCRDMGLQPVMMFSTIYPEHKRSMAVLTWRIKQAAAAGISQLLTFGHTEGGNRSVWVERFKALGPIARDHNVLIVVKQHGGSTGTGEACADIIREVNDPNVFVNYDAGNVMDYLNLDPIPDIQQCANEIRSFCVKDHRNWPKDEDCGPGFGEIDHYRLFEPVAFTGLTMPLAYENISMPLTTAASTPEQLDSLARRAKEYVEAVINGLQQT
ncbi:MAG: sugar phosphate isomerase/epimerase [Planctomycetota bacterium]|nr:sugar phosphate isomerase/epimerase [Planctomycetota bacterium]